MTEQAGDLIMVVAFAHATCNQSLVFVCGVSMTECMVGHAVLLHESHIAVDMLWADFGQLLEMIDEREEQAELFYRLIVTLLGMIA